MTNNNDSTINMSSKIFLFLLIINQTLKPSSALNQIGKKKKLKKNF